MHDAAREIRRQTYLQALGLDQYVSRRSLPGAAETRRLCIDAPQPIPTHDEPAKRGETVTSPAMPPVVEQPARAPAMAAPPAKRPQGGAIEQFRIAAVQAGGWLWLEDLGDMPLAQEQVQLIAAMATAMAAGGNKPMVAQFDWPMHQNQQLDLGPEAAMTSFGSFVERQLSDSDCAGIVLLGIAVAGRLSADLRCAHRLEIPGTRDMLDNPRLKRQAWASLIPHARG